MFLEEEAFGDAASPGVSPSRVAGVRSSVDSEPEAKAALRRWRDAQELAARLQESLEAVQQDLDASRRSELAYRQQLVAAEQAAADTREYAEHLSVAIERWKTQGVLRLDNAISTGLASTDVDADASVEPRAQPQMPELSLRLENTKLTQEIVEARHEVHGLRYQLASSKLRISELESIVSELRFDAKHAPPRVSALTKFASARGLTSNSPNQSAHGTAPHRDSSRAADSALSRGVPSAVAVAGDDGMASPPPIDMGAKDAVATLRRPRSARSHMSSGMYCLLFTV